MTHASLIERIGPAVIAERLKRPRSHVRVWKHRGIPRALFADLIDAFPEHVTLEALKSGAPDARPATASEAGVMKLGHRTSTLGNVNAERGGRQGVANNLKFPVVADHDATLPAEVEGGTADNPAQIAIGEPGSSEVAA